MKRDVLFLAIVAGLVALALLGTPSSSPPSPQRPVIQRVGQWLAIWFLTGHPAPPVQSVPDHLVNAPADRTVGPEGEPLLDHSDGW